MKARRLILWAAVVGVAAAAIVLASPQAGGLYGYVAAQAASLTGSETTPTVGVDLTAPPTSASCLPCHFRIAEGKQPGILFNHATHMSFECTACHAGNPHLSKGNPSPPMQLCFNCHGVQHGPQGELATGKCRECHTASFDLRPASHVKGWEGKAHADVGRTNGVNDCMMCHQAKKDCDACHIEKGVKVGPMPARYQPIYRKQPQQPSVTVYPSGKTTMGQCSQCHPDLDAFMPGKVIFEHAVHLEKNYACTACHKVGGHQGENIARPDMQTCYQCHGLSHSAAGQVATTQCDKCHPPEFDLKPKNHTATFVQTAHGKIADKDPSYCAMCHEIKFCNDCHSGKKVGSWMQAGQRIVPGDHKLSTWTSKHGKLFLNGKGMCSACHDGVFCTSCHTTPMPHPADWLSNHHGPSVDRGDCKVCHVNRDSCQKCHHDKIRNAPLEAKTCNPCHDEMKQKPATAIKDKAFAEHAVHFDVKKKKGESYRCDDCHVDFGSSKEAQNLEKQQGHDLRLCYSCHGALDLQSKPIAPWPGAELCKRCHSNLNL